MFKNKVKALEKKINSQPSYKYVFVMPEKWDDQGTPVFPKTEEKTIKFNL